MKRLIERMSLFILFIFLCGYVEARITEGEDKNGTRPFSLTLEPVTIFYENHFLFIETLCPIGYTSIKIHHDANIIFTADYILENFHQITIDLTNYSLGEYDVELTAENYHLYETFTIN